MEGEEGEKRGRRGGVREGGKWGGKCPEGVGGRQMGWERGNCDIVQWRHSNLAAFPRWPKLLILVLEVFYNFVTRFDADGNNLAYVPNFEQLTAKVDSDKMVSVLRVDPGTLVAGEYVMTCKVSDGNTVASSEGTGPEWDCLFIIV